MIDVHHRHFISIEVEYHIICIQVIQIVEGQVRMPGTISSSRFGVVNSSKYMPVAGTNALRR